MWAAVGVALILAELLTLTFVLALAGTAALAAALVAVLGVGLPGQVAAFVVATAGLLVGVRGPLTRRLRRAAPLPGGDPRALTGATALVVQRVSDDGGQVRLNGELWRARPYAGTGPVEPGALVSVAAVQGATLLVYSPELT